RAAAASTFRRREHRRQPGAGRAHQGDRGQEELHAGPARPGVAIGAGRRHRADPGHQAHSAASRKYWRAVGSLEPSRSRRDRASGAGRRGGRLALSRGADEERLRLRPLPSLQPRNWVSGMRQKLICLLIGCAALTASAHAETVGVVMMHGKHGTPSQLQQIADTIAEAGFAVERPEMCWSAARIYDRTYLECFADIDAAAARLKARGATTIVVLGMSLGGNAALGFGARRQGLAAIVAGTRACARISGSTPGD